MRRSVIYVRVVVIALMHLGFSPSYGQGVEKEKGLEKKGEFEREDITVKVADRNIVVTILSPPKNKLADRPALLMTFGYDRHVSLFKDPYSLTARAFLKQGHRVLSFDLPCHGERVDKFGKWINGFRNSFIAGTDPFEIFVEDGQAVITNCINRGLATPGKIAVGGASRAGYMALRLLAADTRIAAGIGMAPVTDWRQLSEFAPVRERGDVADLQLTHFVKQMIGKHIYLAIGKNDNRVGTDACRDFYRVLKKTQADAKCDVSSVRVKLTDDPGHSVNSGYQEGIEFLLRWSDER